MVAQQVKNQLVFMRMRVWSLALLSGLKDLVLPWQWCRSQTWLESSIAVAVVWAYNCSSHSTQANNLTSWNMYQGKKKTKYILFMNIYNCKNSKATKGTILEKSIKSWYISWWNIIHQFRIVIMKAIKKLAGSSFPGSVVNEPD